VWLLIERISGLGMAGDYEASDGFAIGLAVSPRRRSSTRTSTSPPFAAAVLFVARPVTLAMSLAGLGLTRRERLVAEWFGPKGFPSVVYAFPILKSGAAHGQQVFQIIPLVVVASLTCRRS
jgi:NhaP-type Na+/H+ and K+/H+ antiporter